jgi:hypothetical protein
VPSAGIELQQIDILFCRICAVAAKTRGREIATAFAGGEYELA